MQARRIEKQDSVTKLRMALEKSCDCTSTLIQLSIGQRRIRREAVLEEVIGETIGLMDCTPTGEIDQAGHLIEVVEKTYTHASPFLWAPNSPIRCSVSSRNELQAGLGIAEDILIRWRLEKCYPCRCPPSELALSLHCAFSHRLWSLGTRSSVRPSFIVVFARYDSSKLRAERSRLVATRGYGLGSGRDG